MNKTRLLTLARFLETKRFGKGEFDMTRWKCGTAFCAVGWATTIPQFNRRGFRLASCYAPLFETEPHSKVGCSAVYSFFDVSVSAARHLFNEASYSDPCDPLAVATRIREFVNTHS